MDDVTELADTSLRFAEAIVSNDAGRIASFVGPEWRLVDPVADHLAIDPVC